MERDGGMEEGEEGKGYIQCAQRKGASQQWNGGLG